MGIRLQHLIDGATLVEMQKHHRALPKLPQQTDLLYEKSKPLPNRGLRETAKLHQRILARLSPLLGRGSIDPRSKSIGCTNCPCPCRSSD